MAINKSFCFFIPYFKDNLSALLAIGAIEVAGEAGELAAEFQWLTPEESSGLSKDQLKAVELEMADVAIYLLRLADVLGVDIEGAVKEKIELNEGRFPQG